MSLIPSLNWNSVWQHKEFIKNPRLAARIFKGIIDVRLLGKNRLRSVELMVENACQARCDFCFAGTLMKNAKHKLTVEEIEKIWTECRKLGAVHVNLNGGEPLLRNDIVDVVKACHPEDTLVSLVTNGQFIPRHVKGLADAGLNTLQVSIDSVDPKVHDAWRKVPGLWDKAIKGIKLAKEHGITVCISSVLTPTNQKEFDDILELAEELDTFLLINIASPVGSWKNNKKILLSEQDFKMDQDYWKHPRIREDNMYNFHGEHGCPAGVEKIYITTEGDAYACDRIQNKSYGNVLKEGVEPVWRKMWPDWMPIYKSCADCLIKKESWGKGKVFKK